MVDAMDINMGMAGLVGKAENPYRSSVERVAENAPDNIEIKRLEEACQDFEAIFIHELLKLMRESGPKSDLFESSFAKDVYEDMMDEQLAKEMSLSGVFGVADVLFEHAKQGIIADSQVVTETIRAE